MSRKSGIGIYLIAMVAMLAITACAQDECQGLYYTGDLFDKYGATGLRAQVGCPCSCQPDPNYLAGAGLWFQACNLWGTQRTNGPVNTVLTNVVGQASSRNNLGPGLYEVQAFGAEGGPLEGVVSPPVAVTVVSDRSGCGIIAGGALILDGEEPGCDEENVNALNDPRCRRATFGLLYDIEEPAINPLHLVGDDIVGKLKPIEFTFNLRLPDAKSEQLLFLDPCNPDGAVKIESTNFRTATIPVFVHINLWPFWFYIRFEGFKFTGYCQYTVGDGPTQTKYFEAVLSHHYSIFSKSPYFKFRDATFDIEVGAYPNTTLYKAGGTIEGGGSQIF